MAPEHSSNLLTTYLAEDGDKDYATSHFWAIHWEASSKPESELAWPADPHVHHRKLFIFEKMLMQATCMDQVVQEWHDRQLLHLVLQKMRLEMKRRLEFPSGFCKTLKGVCGSCKVCQAVQLPKKSQAGNADCTL